MEIWRCLQEILELTETEKFWENGDNIGYDLPDGKHHLFIYIDDSADEQIIVIEPNLIVDGIHEPCGDNGLCGMDDIGKFLIEVAWVIETQCQEDVNQIVRWEKGEILEKSFDTAVEMSFLAEDWTKTEIKKEVAGILSDEYGYYICMQKWKFYRTVYQSKEDAIKFLYERRKLYEKYNLAVRYMSKDGLAWYVKSE